MTVEALDCAVCICWIAPRVPLPQKPPDLTSRRYLASEANRVLFAISGNSTSVKDTILKKYGSTLIGRGKFTEKL
jgi:hypothetical protein